MINSISGSYGTSDAAAAMQSASYKSEQAKAEGFAAALNEAAANNEDKELMVAAQEFESYFLQMMLKEMRNTIPNDGLIPKSNAEEIFTSMLDEEYSKNAASGKGMGIAQMIYDQMTLGNRTVAPVSSESDNEKVIRPITGSEGQNDLLKTE